jgi:HAE1 family hydrophobic/amphiphilic exporter-1
VSGRGGPGLSAWAIRNPTPVVLLFVALGSAGIASYVSLPAKQFPDISFALVTVSIAHEGAAPAELETQVTREVENAVFALPGVKHVQSSITQGFTQTFVEFEIGIPTQDAIDRVRNGIDGIRSDLPQEIEEPLIERLELDAAALLTYTVEAPELDAAELAWFVDDRVARRLMAIRGVAEVPRLGGADREINVTLDPARLAALGVSAPEVNDALRRFHADASGGRAEIGAVEQTIRVLGAAPSVEALRRLSIATPHGPVRLAELASVGDGLAEKRRFARLDGRPVVGFQVMKTKQASEIDVEDAVAAAITDLADQNPGVAFRRVASIVEDTRKSMASTQEVLIEGMVLAALTVFWFLRDFRSTAIAALAMPCSLVPAFAAMALVGFSLNMLTLLALTLVIGILVDDAIVEIENIHKRIAAGASPFQAALEGADEIGLAVVATTFAIIVVFAPVSFMPGIGGQYFNEFGLTVAAAVFFSLVVARLLTPLLAAYLLRPSSEPHAPEPLPAFYTRALQWALAHRAASIAIGFLAFLIPIGVAATLPSGFMPMPDRSSFELVVRGSPGATRATLERSVAELTARLHTHPDVASVFAQMGGNGVSDDLRDGSVIVVLRDDRTTHGDDVKAAVRPLLRTIPDALVVTKGGIAGSDADVELILSGDDGAALETAALRLQREMRGVPGISDIRTGTPPPGPELVIRPRVEEAARLGVSSETLAAIVRIATLGEIDALAPKLTIGERRIPIRVRLPEAGRADLATLRMLQVPTADGGRTPLASVADLSFQAGPGRIERFDRERQIAIQADLVPGTTLGAAMAKVTALPALQELPPGVRQPAYGDAEAMAELFGGFAAAMAAGIGMIFAVLVLLFGGFLEPLVILSALPLSFGGAFLSLALFGLPIDLPVLIGILMLMGLAAKNSILLVEFAIERERAGASRRAAILAACNERARPIVMTTFAMAAGMLPAAMGFGEGYEVRQSMAVAVIGGLASSTALSLVLVPVVYEVVAAVADRLRARLGRYVTADAAGQPPLPAGS